MARPGTTRLLAQAYELPHGNRLSQLDQSFILFHHKRHPKDMGTTEIRAFLAHLALHEQVAASTQKGALHALLLLYRHVLKQPFPDLDDIERAQRPQPLPTVFTREEAHAVLAQLGDMASLMAGLLS